LVERGLRLGGGGDGIDRAREGDEEGVALRVHLDPAVARACLADHAAVLGEEIGVGVPVLFEQARYRGSRGGGLKGQGEMLR
jgi:hypothetical protein